MDIKFSTLLLLAFIAAQPSSAQKPFYKICVPKSVLPACNELMSKKSELADINCVAGRDRVECLGMVERREADFMAADPEDLYLAFKKKNEDYLVFADIRTREEMRAEFRYEAIILIRKNSTNINSLADLKGKKSCHTGYGRNVGYKIPLTKLQNAGIFKIDPDVHLAPVEREIKALSEFFSQSCLVGKYSSNDELTNKLKKSYSNLCALCEDPLKCDYPDRYSGYDGAIKCLTENGGDVAFTKVVFVRKYFGLPIGHADKSLTEAQANPDDYVYLCSDGTKVPVTGPACTWAARPWQAYVGNGDIRQKQLVKLQRRLEIFYEDAKSVDHGHQKYAEQMLVNEKNVVVGKEGESSISPGVHLDKAKYREVIERHFINDKNSTIGRVVRICVSSNVEMKKCQVMKDVAFSRDIRPEIECVLKDFKLCSIALKNNEADVIVVQARNFEKRDLDGLKAILFESYEDDAKYVIVADADSTASDVKKATLKYDPNDSRSINAALRFYNVRKTEQLKRTCPNNLKNDENGRLEVMSIKQLNKLNLNANEKVLICQDLSRKSLSEFKLCNFDSTLPAAIYVNRNANSKAADVIKHVFLTLSTKFGHQRPLEVVFEMFGEFEKDQHDVLFDDDAEKFVEENKGIDIITYKKLHCLT